MANKIPRYMSVFIPRRQKWMPVYPSRPCNPAAFSSPLSLLTWNIDFASVLATRRVNGLLDYIFSTGVPDIVFLQEVRRDVHTSLLNNLDIRQHCLITDTYDDTAFTNGGTYTNVTLLARNRFDFAVRHEGVKEARKSAGYAVGHVYRKELPSAYGRTGLCVDLIPHTAPAKYIRLINTHLESYGNITTRSKQIKLLSQEFRELGCSGGLIAGDFNATCAEDHELLESNGLQDAWLSLRKSEADATTWGSRSENKSRYIPARLDKIAVCGLKPLGIDIIRPGCIEVPKPNARSGQMAWSDHSGIILQFTTE